jgi:hypothetical protein
VHDTDLPIHPNCQNCGTPLSGPYCHRCGQHDLDFHRAFGHVFLELLENFFHFDGKFFRNLHTLLFRPGVLSAEFNAGKRAAQVPPFRLYIFVSVLFFFVSTLNLSTDPKKNPPDSTESAPAAAASKTGSKADSFETVSFGDNVKLKMKDVPKHRREIMDSIQKNRPKLLMVCVPLFALYTLLLFRKSGLPYLGHLIVAVHFHTFICLLWWGGEGWKSILALFSDTAARGFENLLNLYLLYYLYAMLRRVFPASRPAIAFKTAVLALVYGATLLLGLVVLFALAVYFHSGTRMM